MTSPGHAVVVGAGMAGLLAARVLADHIEQVTLVERDELPDGARPRRCVPQSRMLHALLPRGQRIVERLFPGYGRELLAAGVVPLHLPTDAVMLTPAGWLDRRAVGWPLLSASRPLYEWALRRRLQELPGLRILDRHEVTSLRTARDGRVTGVLVRPLDATNGADREPAERELAADLVVDAGGRGSRAPAWLSDAGYGRHPRRTSTRRSPTPPGSTASRPGSARTGRWRCCSRNRRRSRAPATCSRSRTPSGWWG